MQGSEEMAQWFRVLVALAKDSGLVSAHKFHDCNVTPVLRYPVPSSALRAVRPMHEVLAPMQAKCPYA